MIHVSIVIPAYNAAGTLAQQLRALGSQIDAARHEVIVVDNGSTDDTATIARQSSSGEWLRVISASERRGPSYARNVGAAHARGLWIGFVDADDVVDLGWLEAMENASRGCELCTGSLDSTWLNEGGNSDQRGMARADSAPSYYGLFPTLAAGNMLISRPTWDRLGGFDESMNACEDVELAVRARATGIAVRFVPDAIVHYRYRGDAGALFTQGRRYGEARVRIAALLRQQGLDAPVWYAGWKSWIWLATRMFTILSADGRRSIAWVAGNRIGHVVGMARYRTALL